MAITTKTIAAKKDAIAASQSMCASAPRGQGKVSRTHALTRAAGRRHHRSSFGAVGWGMGNTGSVDGVVDGAHSDVGDVSGEEGGHSSMGDDAGTGRDV